MILDLPVIDLHDVPKVLDVFARRTD